MDCGPPCLRMVAKHYGRSISHTSFRDKAKIGKEGVNLLGISEAAEAIGFLTLVVKISFHSLVKDVRLPAILRWHENHFVVLYRTKGKKIFGADPPRGLIT